MFEASRLKNRQCNCTGCTGQNGALEYFYILISIMKKQMIRAIVSLRELTGYIGYIQSNLRITHKIVGQKNKNSAMILQQYIAYLVCNSSKSKCNFFFLEFYFLHRNLKNFSLNYFINSLVVEGGIYPPCGPNTEYTRGYF